MTLEKDFYLTVLLHYICNNIKSINFKGWTCLNKWYFPYFRLSEDLDFMVCYENHPWKNERIRFAREIRNQVVHIADTLWWSLNPEDQQHKRALWNNFLKNKKHTYLKYIFTYPSLINWENQTIKLEVTYTQKQYLPSNSVIIHDIYKDLIFNKPLFKEEKINCVAIEEMMAEKLRACVSRREPAIRDFYDIRFILEKTNITLDNIKPLFEEKIKENTWDFTIYNWYPILEKQIKLNLLPMLWESWTKFNLKETYDKIINFIKV